MMKYDLGFGMLIWGAALELVVCLDSPPTPLCLRKEGGNAGCARAGMRI